MNLVCELPAFAEIRPADRDVDWRWRAEAHHFIDDVGRLKTGSHARQVHCEAVPKCVLDFFYIDMGNVLSLLAASSVLGCASTKKAPLKTAQVHTPTTKRAAEASAQARVSSPSPTVKLVSHAQEPPQTGPAQPLSEARSSAQEVNPLAPVELVPAPDPTVFTSDRSPFALDLATALGMTQGQNPRVAFAQAQISQAYAEYDRARILWLPSIRGGMNYNSVSAKARAMMPRPYLRPSYA